MAMVDDHDGIGIPSGIRGNVEMMQYLGSTVANRGSDCASHSEGSLRLSDAASSAISLAILHR